MKAWNKTKLTISMAGLLSLAVVANVNFEKSLYSDSFMIDTTSSVVSRRLDDSFARVVASEKKAEKIAVKYLELSEANKAKINGTWEVMRGFEDINDKVSEFYNKYNNPTGSVVKVNVEMGAGGVYVTGEEFENFFYISDITDEGTLSIVRKLGDAHFEVLEAKKLKVSSRKIEVIAKAEKSEKIESREYKKGVELQKDLDMVIERALLPELSKDVIIGDLVSGSLNLSGGNIEGLSAVIRNNEGLEKSIDISYAEIKDGGQFQVDYMGEVVHGIITNNGTDAYRVRFATGPLQGAMLNFMTYEQLDLMREREEEAKWKTEEAAAMKEEMPVENQQRSTVVAPEFQEQIKEEVIEGQYEDSVTLIENTGFNFSSERKPASAEEK